MRSGRGTRLVLVRHGETDWNTEGRWQGQTGLGLNGRGRRQAAATSAHLAATFPEAALVARSDSRRVAETSAPLEVLLGVPVLVDPRLREMDVGRWSGRTRAEVQAMDPDGYAAYKRNAPVRIGGGERVSDLAERMLAAIDDVVAEAEGGTAIVMTHGWALRVAVAGLLGLSDEDAEALGRASNCSITTVEVGERGVELTGFAGCLHLGSDGVVSDRSRVGAR